MRDGRLQDRINIGLGVEPAQKVLHFALEQPCRRRLKVNAFTIRWTGHDLHRSRFVVAPGAVGNSAHPAASRWKESRMPAEYPLVVKRRFVFFRGVEDHLDNALDAT